MKKLNKIYHTLTSSKTREVNVNQQELILDNLGIKTYGNVLINIPFSYKIITLGVSVIILSLICFLLFAEYSEQCHIRGYLSTNKGLANVYTNQAGIIVKRFQEQGNIVKKGDDLFEISGKNNLNSNQSYSFAVMQLKKNQQIIQKNILISQKNLKKMKQLLIKKYISEQEYNQAHEKLSLLYQQKNQIQIEIKQQEEQNISIIKSPVDGIISNIMYYPGQFVSINKPLLSIIPNNSHFIAKLYIPVNNVKFLRQNTLITLKYDSYFNANQANNIGKIKSVSNSTLTDQDEDKPFNIGQPYYTATASLKQPFIVVNSKKYDLHHGMTFIATLYGTKQKIWQWLLGKYL